MNTMTDETARRVMDFTSRLFCAIAPCNGNFVMSPHSLATLLGVLALGARGETKLALLRALSLADDDSLRALLSSAASTLKRQNRVGRDDLIAPRRLEGLQLPLENGSCGVECLGDVSLWLEEGLRPSDEFRKVVEGLLPANFATVCMDADGVRRINEHVSRATRGLIPTILKEIPPQGSRLIATSALYLNAKWMSPFPDDATTSYVFHAPDGKIKVPFMCNINAYPCCEVGGTVAVAIPYVDADFEMQIFMPKTKTASVRLSNHVQFSKMLAECRAALRATAENYEEIDLRLPKFSVTSDHEMTEAVQTLGAGAAFDPDADFSGLLQESEPVAFSSIVQSACVRVDEEGTEAAAATAVCFDTGCPFEQPKPRIVRINRPFVFIVHNRRTGLDLFAGRIENPSFGSAN